MAKVIIGGDVCPINRNLQYFRRGDAKSIFGDLLEEFINADLSIVNFECPLIEENTPIFKEGPIHAVSSDCINGIKASGIDLLCLANNHILDHGATGLLNTLRVCKDAGITTVGAGVNLDEANRLIVKDVKGVKIAILAYAEHEFSIATEDAPGANPLNIINYIRTIKKHNKEFDYLIVLVHAGVSGYPLPSPHLQEACRFMAEMGANTIICQHSHCAGTYEIHNGSHIVYGQGNLIFDLNTKACSMWNKGFLVQLTIINKNEHFMDIIPYVQSVKKIGAQKMSKNDEHLFKTDIENLSCSLSDKKFIQQKWIKYCEKNKNQYYFKLLFGFLNSRIFRMINRKTHFASHLYSRGHLTLLENIIMCESHREVVETILKSERK